MTQSLAQQSRPIPTCAQQRVQQRAQTAVPRPPTSPTPSPNTQPHTQLRPRPRTEPHPPSQPYLATHPAQHPATHIATQPAPNTPSPTHTQPRTQPPTHPAPHPAPHRAPHPHSPAPTTHRPWPPAAGSGHVGRNATAGPGRHLLGARRKAELGKKRMVTGGSSPAQRHRTAAVGPLVVVTVFKK